MNVDKVVDFTVPYMATQKALQDVHASMLEKDYETATQACIHALVELKLVLNCIKHEEEQWAMKNFTPRG